MPGFVSPQGFLASILQTHARKHSRPVEELKFDFVVLEVSLDQQAIYAAHMADGRFEVRLTCSLGSMLKERVALSLWLFL
jgi:hypothetical protein